MFSNKQEMIHKSLHNMKIFLCWQSIKIKNWLQKDVSHGNFLILKTFFQRFQSLNNNIAYQCVGENIQYKFLPDFNEKTA